MVPPRPVFIGIITLLAIISIATLGLKASTFSFINSNLDSNLLPPIIYVGPARLAVASSSLFILISLLLLLFAFRYWPNGSRTYLLPPHMILPIIVAKLATLSLAALIYTLLAHNLSALPSPGISTPLTTDEVIMLLRNDFEIETWACGLAVPGAHGLWEQRCMIEKVGRWMLVPQSVMGFLALVVVVAGLGVEKRVMERESWDEEKGKMLGGG